LGIAVTDIAIRVQNLSKRYRIGGPQARYKTLRDTVTDMAVAPVRRLRRLGRPAPSEETIWALKGVSFEVKRGEVVGIIGRNGAGKTTLLKVLSRITEPTEGHAEIHGRVGSLLEVGTGFHPELTGRENIYLNGAILGMKRAEIDDKFDEIVQFAEIEKFLDTPVKRYSSGMYVRLAFAVAAHLEPEILLVDEVLAVGDAGFQKKCLGKMGHVAREGRTVLFVSHNMGAVERLCSRSVLMESGRVKLDAATRTAIDAYLDSLGGPQDTPLASRADRDGNQRWRFADYWITGTDGHRPRAVRSGDDVNVHILISATESEPGEVNFSMGFYLPEGRRLFSCASAFQKRKIVLDGDTELIVSIPNLPLDEGVYYVTLFMASGMYGALEVIDVVTEAFRLEVISGDYYRTGGPSQGGTFFVDHSIAARPAGGSGR
jgi:lipopolysaccharide transport system ATP-binding protein